jgi:hypothetical protein
VNFPEEQPADKEAAKHEKQVHARPAEPGPARRHGLERAGVFRLDDRMSAEDKQHRNTA